MTQLKPILLISYFFPPLGMAGSARAYGLFRYLPEFGYRPYVVTVKDIAYPAYDTTLLNEADERYIVRTESLDPSRILWRLGRKSAPKPSHANHLTRWMTPDYKRLWVGFAARAAARVIAKENIEMVMTTSPSPSAHLVGQRLRQSFDVQWLADYRDMWVTRPIESAYARDAQKTACAKLLRDFRRSADLVTAVNNSIAKYTSADKVITNAVDPETCSLWDTKQSSDGTSDSVLRIGYLGTTDTAQTIELFVKALAAALKARNLRSDLVKALFVGSVDEAMLREQFERVGLGEALQCLGYLPRHQAIVALSGVDAILVTIPEDMPYVTPSKMFDCLVSGRPLIVLAPRKSELAELAISANETVFAFDEQAKLQEFMAELLEAKEQTGVCRDSAKFAAVIQSRRERHTWRAMAKQFAHVFEDMMAKK